MSRKKNVLMITAGILVGMAMNGPTALAAEAFLKAFPSTQAFYLDGQQIEMEAYAINGNNYIKLRDIGQAVGFNVSYDGATNSVLIQSDEPYSDETQVAQVTVTSLNTNANGSINLPSDGSQYIPKTGDVIRCDDGTNYAITDVSRYNNSMFASDPTAELPTPTCDWSLLPQPELPAAEARHFTIGGNEYLFTRNLYETRRMLYTLYNAIGANPETWRNGAPVRFPSGSPKVNINLTISNSLTPQSFWPWRESEIVNLFNSCPPGTYSMEAWDVYKDGIFLYTEYKICVI